MDVEFGVKATEEFINDEVRRATREEINKLLKEHKWRLPLRIARRSPSLKKIDGETAENLIEKTIEATLIEMGIK